MILPVARLPLADEASSFVESSVFLVSWIIYGLVFGKILKGQVLLESNELLVGQRFPQELGQSLNFRSQILNNRQLVPISKFYEKIIYLFEVFIENEMQIRVVTLVPGLQDVGEEWRVHY